MIWGFIPTKQWTTLLVRNNKYEERGRHLNKTQKITDVIYRDEHIENEEHLHSIK